MHTPHSVSGSPDDGHGPRSRPEFDFPEGVSSLGEGLFASGEIRAAEHLIIEGRFDGKMFMPDHELAVGRRGSLNGEVLARTINVLGRAAGRLVADRVEIANGATVEAEIITERLVLADGGFFKGVVDPTRADAAFAVFRHERSKRGAGQELAPQNAAKRSAEAQAPGAGGWAETPSPRGVSGRQDE